MQCTYVKSRRKFTNYTYNLYTIFSIHSNNLETMSCLIDLFRIHLKQEDVKVFPPSFFYLCWKLIHYIWSFLIHVVAPTLNHLSIQFINAVLYHESCYLFMCSVNIFYDCFLFCCKHFKLRVTSEFLPFKGYFQQDNLSSY